MAEAGLEKALETARPSGRGFRRRKRLSCHSVGIGHWAGDTVANDRLGAMKIMGRRPILATAFRREVMGARDPFYTCSGAPGGISSGGEAGISICSS